jgi:hypothetical protein
MQNLEGFMNTAASSTSHARFGMTYGRGSELNTRFAAFEKREVIFMGINPGAGNGATEEKPISRSEKAWRTRCSRIAKAFPHEIVFAELIGTPSLHLGELRDKGLSIEEEIRLGAEQNLELIRHHKPSIIFLSTISDLYLRVVAEFYQLERVGDPICRKDSTQAKIAQVFRMQGSGIIWIAMRHISRNFSNPDRGSVHDHAAIHNWQGTETWRTSQ